MSWGVAALLLLAPDWTSDDAAVRLAGVESLQYPKSAAAIPMLIELAADDDEGVRKAAAKKLGAWGRERLRAYLALLGDPPAHFVEEAQNLAAWQAEELRKFSILLIKRTAEQRRTGAALCALARYASDDLDGICGALVLALEDKDEGVRSMAATSLSLLGWGAVAGEDPVGKVAGLRKALFSKHEGVQLAGFALLASLRTTDPEAMAIFEKPAKEPLFDIYRKRTLESLRGPQSDFQKELERCNDWLDVAAKGGYGRGALRATLERIRDLGPHAASLKKRVAGILDAEKSNLMIVRAGQALFAIAPESAEEVAKRVTPIAKKPVEYEEELSMEACVLLARLGPPGYGALLHMLRAYEPDPPSDWREWFAGSPGYYPYEVRAKRLAARAFGKAASLPEGAKPLLQGLVKHKDPALSYLAARALRAR